MIRQGKGALGEGSTRGERREDGGWLWSERGRGWGRKDRWTSLKGVARVAKERAEFFHCILPHRSFFTPRFTRKSVDCLSAGLSLYMHPNTDKYRVLPF